MDLAVRMQPTLVENVSSVSLSEFVGNSAQLVIRAPGIIRAARDLADVVIVEAPPVLAYHDTEALSSAVDVVLVVGDCVETKLERAKRAGELLRRMNAPVLGVVLTSVEIGTRDIRHLVSARPESKGVEEPLEGVLEPAPHAGSSRPRLRNSRAGGDRQWQREEGETVPDREPETLEHVRNGNGNGNGERRCYPRTATNARRTRARERTAMARPATTGAAPTSPRARETRERQWQRRTGTAKKRWLSPSREPATLEPVSHGTATATATERERQRKGGCPDREPETLEHVTNGNGTRTATATATATGTAKRRWLSPAASPRPSSTCNATATATRTATATERQRERQREGGCPAASPRPSST